MVGTQDTQGTNLSSYPYKNVVKRFGSPSPRLLLSFEVQYGIKLDAYCKLTLFHVKFRVAKVMIFTRLYEE